MSCVNSRVRRRMAVGIPGLTVVPVCTGRDRDVRMRMAVAGIFAPLLAIFKRMRAMNSMRAFKTEFIFPRYRGR